jgi:hypothetical protein
VGSFFRRPLGAFVATLVVGSAVLAVGMTAFGGTSGAPSSYHAAKPLTRAQFRRAGVRIGRSICLQLRPIVNKKPRTLREFTTGIRRIDAIFNRLRTEMYGLVPPPSAAASFQGLRRNLNAFGSVLHRLDHMAQTRQWWRFVLLARSRWFRHIVRRFGPIKTGKLRCGQASRTIT